MTAAKTHVTTRRALNLLKTLVKNRMALLGLVMLFGSVFVAVAAPLLTSHDPQSDIVSGALAQPEWMMNFQDGFYLSRNIILVSDPAFSSAGAVQAWTITASPSTLSQLTVSYAPGVSTPTTKGSLQISYTGVGPATVSVSRVLNYPYYGPPKKFSASVSFLSTGVSIAQPMGIRVYLDRLGDQVFNLFTQNQTSSAGWVTQPLDSDGNQVPAAIGIANGAILNPAGIIFSSRQDYSYGVAVTFNGPQTVNLTGLQIQLFGTAFGLLGTDNSGRDLFSQLIYGARISLLVGLTAAGIGIALGLVIGLMAGYLGKLIDELLMRFTDIMLTIPTLPLLLVLVAVLGSTEINIILVIGFLGWMGFARVIRSQVLSLRERPFIEAAKAAGSGPFRIMTRHIFPNIVSLTYVNLALTVPGAILSEAALSFLGLGDPNIVSWGNMFHRAQEANELSIWWWIIPPGLGIAIVSLSFVFIGYALDEIFNPKLRQRR